MTKKIITFIAMTALALAAQSDIVDTYKLTIRAGIPQVYDNFSSKGYRKFKTQRIEGFVYATYDNDGTFNGLDFGTFTNKSQKTSSGQPITYEPFSYEDSQVVWCFIGNNKTSKFTTSTVKFNLELQPNYVSSRTNDDTLILDLSGAGSSKSVNQCKVIDSVSGYGSGQMGCGCAEYGHVSPTRNASAFGPDLTAVTDISALKAVKWQLKFQKRTTK